MGEEDEVRLHGGQEASTVGPLGSRLGGEGVDGRHSSSRTLKPHVEGPLKSAEIRKLPIQNLWTG